MIRAPTSLPGMEEEDEEGREEGREGGVDPSLATWSDDDDEEEGKFCLWWFGFWPLQALTERWRCTATPRVYTSADRQHTHNFVKVVLDDVLAYYKAVMEEAAGGQKGFFLRRMCL